MAAPKPHALDLGELEFTADTAGGVELAGWVDRLRALVREHDRLSVHVCRRTLR